MDKDISLIPEGMYCYKFDLLEPDRCSNEPGAIPTVSCPYSSYKKINGVNIPWCDFLEAGGLPNGGKEGDFEKLVEYYGSEDAVFDNLTLDLLFDDCKECGENDDYEKVETEEEIIEWIKKVNEYKSKNKSHEN